jgi:hypothetical protein
MSDDTTSTCVRCNGRIRWLDCPTGGWWAHEEHPADNHDALSMFELIEDLDDGARWITLAANERPTYTVEVFRDESAWAIKVPAIECAAKARGRHEIEPRARDLIASMTGAAADSFDLALPDLPAPDYDRIEALRTKCADMAFAAYQTIDPTGILSRGGAVTVEGALRDALAYITELERWI